jgi:hypothetical protein
MPVQERSAVNIPPHLGGQLYAKHNHNDDLSSDFGRGQWDSRPDRQGRRQSVHRVPEPLFEIQSSQLRELQIEV